jgi:hypothetical protein
MTVASKVIVTELYMKPGALLRTPSTTGLDKLWNPKK